MREEGIIGEPWPAPPRVFTPPPRRGRVAASVGASLVAFAAFIAGLAIGHHRRGRR